MPLSCLQGAGFAGAATGSNLARDIEQGWFDRLLVSPVPRPLLLVGPILGAITRSLVPATVVLIVGLLIGAELTGGVPGLLALYFACAAFCACAALWGIFMAVTFRTQQAGPLMQQGVFLAVFLSTAYTPEVLLRGLARRGRAAATRSPTCSRWRARRRSSGSSRALRTRCPGSLALGGHGGVLGTLAMFGLRRMGH